MKWPHATLTDQQVRETYFVVPEVGTIHALALGPTGYQRFREQRQLVRLSGGELLVIGWPDGTTVTLQIALANAAVDLDTLVQTYRASAAIYRATQPHSQP